MTPRTLPEKILSAKSGADARTGDFVVCEPDLILGTDGSTPMALDYFAAMGGRSVRNPERVLLARDHYAPPTSPSTLGFHARMEDFADRHGVELLPVGGGIGFQVALETQRVAPGDLVVGADSHTVMCGAVGAFATGIGSADLAGALLTGQVWLRIPGAVRVVLDGVRLSRRRNGWSSPTCRLSWGPRPGSFPPPSSAPTRALRSRERSSSTLRR
jgi:3-isopropylmalate/(R)-2-methylmalate dehydratase large subunit